MRRAVQPKWRERRRMMAAAGGGSPAQAVQVSALAAAPPVLVHAACLGSGACWQAVCAQRCYGWADRGSSQAIGRLQPCPVG